MIRYKYDGSWYQKVYLVTDPEQLPWQLTGISLTPEGVMFSLSRLGETIDVYDGEFTYEMDNSIKLGLKAEE